MYKTIITLIVITLSSFIGGCDYEPERPTRPDIGEPGKPGPAMDLSSSKPTAVSTKTTGGLTDEECRRAFKDSRVEAQKLLSSAKANAKAWAKQKKLKGANIKAEFASSYPFEGHEIVPGFKCFKGTQKCYSMVKEDECRPGLRSKLIVQVVHTKAFDVKDAKPTGGSVIYYLSCSSQEGGKCEIEGYRKETMGLPNPSSS